MISLAFFGHAVWNLDRILAESPGCLTEKNGELAHRVAAYRGGNITLDFTAEQTLFDDTPDQPTPTTGAAVAA